MGDTWFRIMISVPTAIEVFARSFSYVRSFTHPVEIIDQGALWTIRDTPGRKGGSRTEEILVFPGSRPEAVVSQLRHSAPQGRFFLDVFQAEEDPPDEINNHYKHQGYRRLRTESLMALSLRTLSSATPRHKVLRVETQAQADAVAEAARQRLIKSEHLSADATVRVYYVEKEGKVVAWTRSVHQSKDASYVAGMYTEAEYRRQGMASALLGRLASDEANSGVHHSVLLASRLGSLLYAHFGYTQIGRLHMFAPK